MVQKQSVNPDDIRRQKLKSFSHFVNLNWSVLKDHVQSTTLGAYRKGLAKVLPDIGQVVLDLSPLLFGLLTHSRLCRADSAVREAHVVTIAPDAIEFIKKFVGSAPYAGKVQLTVSALDNLLAFINLSNMYQYFDTVIVADLFFYLPDEDTRKQLYKFLYDCLRRGGNLVNLELFTRDGNLAQITPATFMPSLFVAVDNPLKAELAGFSADLSFAGLSNEIGTVSGFFLRSFPSGTEIVKRVSVSDEFSIVCSSYKARELG